MKRYISLLLILPLILAAVAAPASAAEANYGVYNLLDYGQLSGAAQEDVLTGEVSFPLVVGNTIWPVNFDDYGFLSVSFHNPGIINVSGWSALVILDRVLDLKVLSGDLIITETSYGENVYFLSYVGPVDAFESGLQIYFGVS